MSKFYRVVYKKGVRIIKADTIEEAMDKAKVLQFSYVFPVEKDHIKFFHEQLLKSNKFVSKNNRLHPNIVFLFIIIVLGAVALSSWYFLAFGTCCLLFAILYFFEK